MAQMYRNADKKNTVPIKGIGEASAHFLTPMRFSPIGLRSFGISADYFAVFFLLR